MIGRPSEANLERVVRHIFIGDYMGTKVYYNAYNKENGHRHEIELESDYDISDETWHEMIAEKCADDWHDNHDGWESGWPRVFAIFADKTSPAIAKFNIEREYEVTFSATSVDA